MRRVWERLTGARRWDVVGTLAGGAILLTALLAVIVYVPQLAIDPHGLTRDQWLTHVQDLRTTILQGLGGLAVLLGAVVAALNLRETGRQNRAVLELQRRGQTTERFTRAIEQLGDANLDVRIGAVYALEQIARDSAELHWPIMEVLTAYLREHRPVGARAEPVADDSRPKRMPADHQAIATVIGRRRRQRDPEGERLDLRATDLAGVRWARAHLEGAWLHGAHLEGGMLNWAHLEGAMLNWAHLERARLYEAHLERAWLSEADLRGALGLTPEQLRAAIYPERAHLSPEQAAWLGPAPATDASPLAAGSEAAPEDHEEPES